MPGIRDLYEPSSVVSIRNVEGGGGEGG
jgi:hypothetical protein